MAIPKEPQPDGHLAASKSLSDWHVTSPQDCNVSSNRQVMRIEKLVCKLLDHFLDLFARKFLAARRVELLKIRFKELKFSCKDFIGSWDMSININLKDVLKNTFFTGGGVLAFGISCDTDVLECPVPLTLMSSIRICLLGIVKPNSRTYLQ